MSDSCNSSSKINGSFTENINKISIAKKYSDYPFSHRQPLHDGGCRFIHGHNFEFEFVFSSHLLDHNGFVVDFGKMKFIREFLDHWFDHTFVADEKDCHLEKWQELHNLKLVDLRIIPNTSAEGLVVWLKEQITLLINNKPELKQLGVYIKKITIWEDSKDTATIEI